ncbi:hypothetical protein HMPREF1982_02843 [Clostridiales bacterium oral taxon 876 str. F0540]|nr:hypothetical protein HMPREF1982_02843 [Clostridiales bacterium oral taxon 876 str. F0540]
MKLSNLDWYLVYKKWTANSGAFEYLLKSSPFVTAKYMQDFELNLNKDFQVKHKFKKVLEENIEENRILIADVDSILGINTAVVLNNEFKVCPILSYNFLFHPYGIVGDSKLIEALAAAADVIEPIKPQSWVFILDKNRYINDMNINNPMVFNNQYEITEEEMPDIDMLRKLNKRSVCFLYDTDIKEDIKCYLDYLKENDFNVNMIDIGEILNE